MIPPSTAHRPDFSVRCACGVEYHTSDAHIGRLLNCKCGRRVKVERAASSQHDETPRTIDPAGKTNRKVRRRRKAVPDYDSYSGDSRMAHARHRVSVLIASTLRPLFTGSPIVRVTAFLAWGYFAAMVCAWALLVFTSERSLPGTIIAYGPRWLALWPLAVLIPLSAIAKRVTLVPLLLGAWVCAVSIMGARFSPTTFFSRQLPALPAAGTFRLLTFNADGGQRLARDLPVMLREQAPDIVTFEECGDQLWTALEAQTGWHTARHGSLCTGSRWPISAVELMPRADLARVSALGFGGTGLVMRMFIATPRGPLVLVNLHLETARKGLEGLLGKEGFIPDGNSTMAEAPVEFDKDQTSSGQRFAFNAEIRTDESARASRFASRGLAQAPLVVAGDFNLPVESSIFQTYWTQFTDAFESKGNGLGWSKREGRWLRIRIDHVLTNAAGPQPAGIMIGPDYGSDHLPVIVDLRWPASMKPTQ